MGIFLCGENKTETGCSPNLILFPLFRIMQVKSNRHISSLSSKYYTKVDNITNMISLSEWISLFFRKHNAFHTQKNKNWGIRWGVCKQAIIEFGGKYLLEEICRTN